MKTTTDTIEITTLRKASAVGPCITLGFVVSESPKFFNIVDRNGVSRRVGKSTLVHTAACRCCTGTYAH
jgi:hypothetical protein